MFKSSLLRSWFYWHGLWPRNFLTTFLCIQPMIFTIPLLSILLPGKAFLRIISFFFFIYFWGVMRNFSSWLILNFWNALVRGFVITFLFLIKSVTLMFTNKFLPRKVCFFPLFPRIFRLPSLDSIHFLPQTEALHGFLSIFNSRESDFMPNKIDHLAPYFWHRTWAGIS